MTIDNSSPTAGDLDSNDAASVVLNVPEDLVRRARFGDLAAFESILTAMVGMPWRMAHSIASDLDFAAAATGEGFALVLGPDVPARWSAPDRAGLYVMAATRAAALSSDGAGPLPRISAGTGPRIGAGTGVGSAGTGRAGLMNLPERWRSMLWMVDVEGLAIPQAGIVMGVSTAAAEKLHARAQAGWTRADLRLAGPPAAGATVHLGTKATVAAQGAGPSRGLRAEVPPVPFTMSRIAVDRWRGHQGMAPSEAGAGTVIPLAARSVSEATLVAASGAAIAGTASSRAIAGGSVISQAGDFRSLVRALAEIGQKPLLSAACALVGVGVIGGSLVALLPGPNPSAGNPVAAPVSAAFPNQINSPGT
ncbi:MAG: RNA polymerase sigma factor, partial [Acidimicrobiales bacterium]